MSRMRQVIIRMPDDMHEALKALASLEDRTMAAEVRRAVRRHLATADPGETP